MGRASKGDEDAWRELVGLYARRVYAVAKSRCRLDDAAQEVTQSVFATIATQLRQGRYTEHGRFEPWLFRVAMNRVRDELRRQKRHAALTLEHAPEPLVSSADAPDEQEHELGRLRIALGQLSETDRELIELRHHGNMSFKQLADLLNEPIGTLLARHSRALGKLRAILQGTQRES